MGRLFDAVAALVGLHQRITHEGQAAMKLEFQLKQVRTEHSYPFWISDTGSSECPWVIDWEPMIRTIIHDIRRNTAVPDMAARYHNTLVQIIIAMARRGEQKRVVLAGGCFQNAYLLEHAIRSLRAEGFEPCWNQRVPANDGGVALGQAAVTLARINAPSGSNESATARRWGANPAPPARNKVSQSCV